MKIYRTMDGNEACASVAYRVSEVVAIYPITPSSTMGEWADEWATQGRPNLWGTVPSVSEMQSEGGAAGAIHGALQGGSLATTFTASQGLLLMIPNMYKIAGELTSVVFHVSARTIATHALSIFGDHSDVMATRSTGFAFLSSASVQEAHDFAIIAQVATLESRIPFLHFFEGFRVSHEVAKIAELSDEDLRAMLDEELVLAHRMRGMTPDRPVLRGTAQNPDVFFQTREACNPYYSACAGTTQKAMDRFAQISGRQYHLFDYYGAPDAERVIVIMGCGGETVQGTVAHLNKRGEKVGVLRVRLYRPFDVQAFMEALPATTERIAVLDRTKEPGSTGEPLYVDCQSALNEGLVEGWGTLRNMPRVIGGRYGLSSKEFTPAMAKGIFDHLASNKLKLHFTISINDDVAGTSLPYDPDFSIESERTFRGLFYGLGSDGTVGANKNSIKIIGENTGNFAQGYFVYDSKKSGAVTVSHLRFGPGEIRAPYLVDKANFVACHQPIFLDRYDMLKGTVLGGTFLLNTPYGPDEVWQHLPNKVQRQILSKKLKFYVIDATSVARDSGMGGRINTIMQTCFFALCGVLERDEAIEQIRKAIVKTYGRKGEAVVQMNMVAVDNTLDNLHEVQIPGAGDSGKGLPPVVSEKAPDFVQNVLGKMIAGEGDSLPVSVLPADGTFPTGTAQWEKRNLALEIPVWEPDICIQCLKCSMVCPHAVIRAKVYEEDQLEDAPETFRSVDSRNRAWKGKKFTIQVAPEDCTGCNLCVHVCPAKSKEQASKKAINMAPQPPIREQEAENWDFFLSIPDVDRKELNTSRIMQQQLQQPLFEFSGACTGCGETAYIKLISQLFGDRMMVANATGCSSIYGGNLPTTPWATDSSGRGPAWNNSLFEDNAEFGFGMRLAVDKHRQFATELILKLSAQIGEELAKTLVNADQRDEAGIYEQRERVALLKQKLESLGSPEAKQLLTLADMLVKKSIWVVGGDGWAYDIGFGGLDHVIAQGRNVNILVLDTEVYSNTGGQMSKATPLGAVAKFAASGKPVAKKDLGLIAMTYGSVYVASVAMGARDEHTLRSFLEAEAYEGPSLIIAYSHCIAHGIAMETGLEQQKAAVDSGQWLLYRYNPTLVEEGKNPLLLDSRTPKMAVTQYMQMQNRFRMLMQTQPERARQLHKMAEDAAKARWRLYEYLASRQIGTREA